MTKVINDFSYRKEYQQLGKAEGGYFFNHIDLILTMKLLQLQSRCYD